MAVALESMLWGFGITTLDELAEAIRFDGNFLAEYIESNDCRRAAHAAMQQQLYVSSTSDAQTQADEQVASRSSQTVLTGEVIDVMTVDEVFDEAMDMLLVADRRILNAELRQGLCFNVKRVKVAPRKVLEQRGGGVRTL